MRSSPGLHIRFRHVTSRNQSVDASSGQLHSVAAEAVSDKWASNPIITTEVVIVPATFIRHRRSDVRCGIRLRVTDNHTDESDEGNATEIHRRSPLFGTGLAKA